MVAKEPALQFRLYGPFSLLNWIDCFFRLLGLDVRVCRWIIIFFLDISGASFTEIELCRATHHPAIHKNGTMP